MVVMLLTRSHVSTAGNPDTESRNAELPLKLRLLAKTIVIVTTIAGSQTVRTPRATLRVVTVSPVRVR